jgi:hypothetical protein
MTLLVAVFSTQHGALVAFFVLSLCLYDPIHRN